MRSKPTTLALAGLLAGALAIRADDYDRFYAGKLKIDPAHSVIGFAVPFMGLSKTEGRFDEFAGTLMFDPEDPTRSSVSVTIRATSLDTNNEARDKDLRSDAFFDVEKYPVITFRSRRIERREGGFTAIGTLTLHGVSKEVTIPLVRLGAGLKDPWGNSRAGFEGSFKLNRAELGIGGMGRFTDLAGDLAIGKEVDVRLAIQAVHWNVARWSWPEKSVAKLMEQTIAEKGLDAALAQYRQLKQQQPEAYEFGIGQLNLLGHRLLQQRKIAEAIAVFQVNAEAYPESADVWDDLADAYAASGQRERAAEASRKSLAIEPNGTEPQELLRRLES